MDCNMSNPRTKAIPVNMCQYNLWWPLPLCIFVVHACHAWTFFYPLDFHFYKENPLLSSGPSGHQQQSDCHSGQPGWFIKCFFTKFSMPSISIVFHWPSSQCDFSFLQQEVGEGDVVSVWEKTTGDLLYQVLATIFLIHLVIYVVYPNVYWTPKSACIMDTYICMYLDIYNICGIYVCILNLDKYIW